MSEKKKEIIAGVILRDNNKFLLVQESKPHIYGLWNIPAGHVEPGESLKKAAEREVKEESGYIVEVGREIFNDSVLGEPVEHHVFDCKIIGGKLEFLKGELLDARWFTAEEIRNMSDKLRNKIILEFIAQ